MAALWFDSALLVGMAAIGVLAFEIAWSIDFLCGGRPLHLAGYMFEARKPLYPRALSLFHLAMPPAILSMLRRRGYDRRSLRHQTAVAWLVMPATYALPDPDKNINWVFGPGRQAATRPAAAPLSWRPDGRRYPRRLSADPSRPRARLPPTANFCHVTERAPMIEGISAITLATHDIACAVRFYRMLGFELVRGGEDAAFTSFRADANHLNLIAQPHQRRWSWWGRVIFYDSDVDGFYSRVIAAELKPETAPRDAEWGERFFHLIDPDGHELSFAWPFDSR
jgi:catechol 2,3-dioxygenase-like lactoylglutathione lyase family enzyme